MLIILQQEKKYFWPKQWFLVIWAFFMCVVVFMACWGAVVDGCVVVVSLWWMDMLRWQLTCAVVVMEGWC